MFGYIVINQSEMKFKEYDVYRSYYCGLCQSLKERYGVLGQLSLNYDMTFILMLLTGLYEPEEQEKDAQRTAYLEKYSIHVVRIPNNEVTGNFRGVCEYIDSLVKQRMEAKDSR